MHHDRRAPVQHHLILQASMHVLCADTSRRSPCQGCTTCIMAISCTWNSAPKSLHLGDFALLDLAQQRIVVGHVVRVSAGLQQPPLCRRHPSPLLLSCCRRLRWGNSRVDLCSVAEDCVCSGCNVWSHLTVVMCCLWLQNMPEHEAGPCLLLFTAALLLRCRITGPRLRLQSLLPLLLPRLVRKLQHHNEAMRSRAFVKPHALVCPCMNTLLHFLHFLTCKASSAAGPTGMLQTLSPRLDAVGVDGGGREVAQRDGRVLDLRHARHP